MLQQTYIQQKTKTKSTIDRYVKVKLHNIFSMTCVDNNSALSPAPSQCPQSSVIVPIY